MESIFSKQNENNIFLSLFWAFIKAFAQITQLFDIFHMMMWTIKSCQWNIHFRMELILDLIFFFKIGSMRHLSNIFTTVLDMASLWKL